LLKKKKLREKEKRLMTLKDNKEKSMKLLSNNLSNRSMRKSKPD